MTMLNGNNHLCECKSGIRKSNTFFGRITEKLKQKLNTRFVTKICFTLLCLSGCAWQASSIVHLYMEYPTIVIIEKKQMERLKLPGITLCNSNRVKRSRLSDFYPHFKRNWSETDEQGNNYDERMEHQKLVDTILRDMLKNLTVAQFRTYGFNFPEFILRNFTRCASNINNQDNPCKNVIDSITSVQDSGNCYTLFHRSRSADMARRAVIPGFANNPIERGKKGAINMEVSEEAMQPNEVLRLKVNFSREEYVILNEPVSGLVIVHDEKEVPIVRRRNFAIFPGNYYVFYLAEEIRYLLPKPYATDCKYYINENEEKGKENIYSYLDSPLSKTDCTIGCMARECMKRCECWPPEVPFIRNPSNDTESMENRMKWCDWTVMKEEAKLANVFRDKNTNAFGYCFSEHQKQCGKKCSNNCVAKGYTFNREIKPWPAQERIDHSSHEDSEYLKLMKKCCAIISIRYWNTMRTVHTYQPKLSDVEFISYMGGIGGLWIGFSFLGFYDVMETIYKWLNKQIKKSNTSGTNRQDYERALRQLSNRSLQSVYPKRIYTNPRSGWHPMSSKKSHFMYGYDIFNAYNAYNVYKS